MTRLSVLKAFPVLIVLALSLGVPLVPPGPVMAAGDTLTRLDDPADLPTGAVWDVAFSPDSAYMAVAHTNSPFVTIYKTPPPVPAVGGTAYPVSRLALMAPWVALGVAIAAASLLVLKRRGTRG